MTMKEYVCRICSDKPEPEIEKIVNVNHIRIAEEYNPTHWYWERVISPLTGNEVWACRVCAEEIHESKN